MRPLRLRTRFILAGSLLIMATVLSSLWSALTLARLNSVVATTLSESQETADICAEIHTSLEREDDAILLALIDKKTLAKQNLKVERERGDIGFKRLLERLKGAERDEQMIAQSLRESIDKYRDQGDHLLREVDYSVGLQYYHGHVNALLRKAVSDCDQLREANFRSMQQAGIHARDEAAKGAQVVSSISIMTVLCGIAVAFWFAQSILTPVRQLSESVDAIRQGDFEKRLHLTSPDELGQLAAGFNRMAEALANYRRSSIDELLSVKNTLETTINALPDAVLVFSSDGELSTLNPPAQRLLNALGNNWPIEVKQLNLPTELKMNLLAALEGHRPKAKDLDFSRTLNVTLNNELCRLMLTAIPVPDAVGNRFGAVAVFDDVTDFVRLDELRSELIGVASHELKSPLTSLRMNLLMLLESSETLTLQQRELLFAAVGGCEELGLTIDELLDVTRIEAGQLRLNFAPVDLVSLLIQVANKWQDRFDDVGIRLTVRQRTSGNEACFVRGDTSRLASVFSNILGNALKYSPSGGEVAIEFSSMQNTQEGQARDVQIAFTDQGPGVPKEFSEKVFEKFFRVEHHVTHLGKEVRGTGIGLYLCREVIRAHGGTIVCRPRANGSGTEIAILVPMLS